MKIETFSLLVSILIHLGLLTAPFSPSPPKSAKYVKSIKVDYLISLPKINHHLRESSGKSILSSLTPASGRENKKLLKPFSTLTKKPSISSNPRSQERILSPGETSNSRKRKLPSLFSPPTKVRESIMESDSLREGTSKVVGKVPGVNLLIDEASILSSFSPLTRAEKSPLIRKIERKGYLSREESSSLKRLADHTLSLATEPLGSNRTLPLRQRKKTTAFVSFSPFQEKKSEPQKKLSLLLTKKSYPPYQILSYSPDPIVWPGIRGYPPTIKERESSPLRSEPDLRQEEIRFLKEDTELLTEGLQLREYAKKIQKLINTNKKYPPVARQRGWEGIIKVRFMITSSGRVIKTEVLSPCSYEVLNRAAEKLIKDTSPFPPFPSSWHKNSLALDVQVVYQLKEPT